MYLFRFISRIVCYCFLSVSGYVNAGMLSIEVANVSIAPNGVGHVAVTVTGTGEAVNLAGYEFRISPDIGTSSQLRFLEDDEEFLSVPDYLFVSSSAALDDGLASSVGSVSSSVLPDDTFVGGDGTADFGNIVVSGNRLLTTLRIQHNTGPADPTTTLGHVFHIDLVPTFDDSVAFSNGAANTGFVDSNSGVVAFVSTPGVITVQVPEPSDTAVLSVMIVSSWFCLWKKRASGIYACTTE